MIAACVITKDVDLEGLVDEINGASWDDANEMTSFDVDSLSAYLERADNLFVACHDTTDGTRTLLGIASARMQLKAYDEESWLYVDEVDVCADQRQKGAGRAIMQRLLEVARESHCEEVWLGTEVDNQAANALYNSLGPVKVEAFVGYTYEMD